MPNGPGLKNRHRPAALPWVVKSGAALTAALLMSACANLPPPATAPTPAPAQPSLQEWMAQAQSAARDGQRERARQAWRSAAKAYPTQKAPWQRLAEDYFDSADYGNAILAAQEVLQRDEHDTLAHSVLAVSGLRLSTVSLVALRERTSYPVGSREEAMGLTRAMRDALGETALVPQRLVDIAAPTARSAPTTAVPPRTTAVAPARMAPNTPTVARATSTTPAVVVPVAAQAPAPMASPQAKPAADPFKLLK